ncbi:MAG: septal ring lytic transglycosylase RlpA family protein [Candidatus Omnitrophica bacterium]|nr:septal ring lytic transglycosylase RlpA family protein [Candidatus Omnitrophota bacterium]
MKNLILILMIVIMATSLPARDLAGASSIYKGMASWYSKDDPGILETTANMERFDDAKLTCAMWDLPFNTVLKVTNLENGKFIFVRVNDRGPAQRLVQQGRIIDLTKAAFLRLSDLENGLIRVSVEII